MIVLKCLKTACCFLTCVLLLMSMPGQTHAQWVEPGGLHNDSRRSFTDPKDMVHADFINPEEKMRTWNKAVVWVPTGPGKSRRMSMQELIQTYTGSDSKFPTAIYLHGCSGLGSWSSLRMKFLADNGFLAIGPASFARKKYVKSCDPATHTSSLFRHSVLIRKIDAGHAIERAKTLNFVDAENMLLIGLSQGGVTTATFKSQQLQHSVRARVIEGWTCHAGWLDSVGLNAPPSEPVLSLVGVNDPWFQGKPFLQGNCGRYMLPDNGSKSVVYETGRLASRHELLEFGEVQEVTLAFLREHFDLPLSVRDVQQILTDLGYDPGPIDGAWGGKTLAALNALRADQSLPSVAELDSASVELLKTLKRN